MVILDTNIIIDHLRLARFTNSILAKLSLTHTSSELAISTITIQELFTGQSSSKKRPLEDIATTLSNLSIAEYTIEVAKLAGALMRKDHKLKFADASIAATAIHYGAHLATLNTKDFAEIPNLKLLKLPSA